MVKVEHILLLTDFSEDSNYALGYARALAELFQTKLYLLHVIENATSDLYGRVAGDYLTMEANARNSAHTFLQQCADKELQQFADHQELVREGAILEEVLKAVAEYTIGTVVMATHGRTGLGHLLLGSVAEKVIRTVHCPVYVVRHPERSPS